MFISSTSMRFSLILPRSRASYCFSTNPRMSETRRNSSISLFTLPFLLMNRWLVCAHLWQRLHRLHLKHLLLCVPQHLRTYSVSVLSDDDSSSESSGSPSLRPRLCLPFLFFSFLFGSLNPFVSSETSQPYTKNNNTIIREQKPLPSTLLPLIPFLSHPFPRHKTFLP